MARFNSISEVEIAIDELVERYRDTCFWSFRPDFLPGSEASRLRALDGIQRHGDRKAFMRAAELREWLFQHSNAKSAVS